MIKTINRAEYFPGTYIHSGTGLVTPSTPTVNCLAVTASDGNTIYTPNTIKNVIIEENDFYCEASFSFLTMGNNENFAMRNNKIEFNTIVAGNPSLFRNPSYSPATVNSQIHDNEIIVDSIDGNIYSLYNLYSEFYNNEVTINANVTSAIVKDTSSSLFRNNYITVNGDISSVGYNASNVKNNTIQTTGSLNYGFRFLSINFTSPVSITGNTITTETPLAITDCDTVGNYPVLLQVSSSYILIITLLIKLIIYIILHQLLVGIEDIVQEYWIVPNRHWI